MSAPSRRMLALLPLCLSAATLLLVQTSLANAADVPAMTTANTGSNIEKLTVGRQREQANTPPPGAIPNNTNPGIEPGTVSPAPTPSRRGRTTRSRG